MKIRQKIIVAGFFLLGLAAVMFTVEKIEPKNGKTAGQEVVTLKLWHPWASEEKAYQKYFNEVIREFNEEHSNIQIEAEGIEMELYLERLPKAIASNDVPDLFYCYTDDYMARIISSGKLLELTNYLSEDKMERIDRSSLEGMTYEGGIYGLSYARNVGVFLINREMFEHYQVPVPEDWEGLLLACREFQKYAVVPLACSGEQERGFILYLEALCLDRAGAAACTAVLRGEGSGNEEALFLEGVKAFELLAEMGAFGDRSRQGSSEAQEDFIMSRIPMYYTKSDFIGTIIPENSPLFGKISVISFPSIHNKKLLTGGISEAFVINKRTKDPLTATVVLEELMERFSAKITEKNSGISTWKNLDKLPKFDNNNMIIKQITLLDKEADEKMQNWELMTDAKQTEHLRESSIQFFSGTITAEDFVAGLRKNMK